MRRHTIFNHSRTLIPLNTKVILSLFLLQYNINVPSDNLLNLLGLCRLNRIVLVGIVAEIKCKRVRTRAPSTDSCQRPCFQNFLRLLIQSQYRVFCDAQQPWNKLIFTFHFLLDKEEGDAVSFQSPCIFSVQDFGVEFGEADVFFVFGEDFLFDSFDFHVRLREEFL